MAQPAPDFAHLLRIEGARLGDVRPEHLDLPIPHLEGWTVHDVVGHVGWVAGYARQALEAAPDALPTKADVPEPPPGPEVVDWFGDAFAQLLTTFDEADLAAPRPTWTGPQKASWWLRRVANEVAVHRWDAEAAWSSPTPVAPRQARDAVDEVLDVFAPHRLQLSEFDDAAATVHLHATDIDDGEWMIEISDTAISWSEGHGKGDVAARGPVSDLLLMMWGRIPPSRLEVFGDSSLLDRWQTSATF